MCLFLSSTTDDTLRGFCSRFGKITDCLVMRTPEGKSRGFGFVTYEGNEFKKKTKNFVRFLTFSLVCMYRYSIR